MIDMTMLCIMMICQPLYKFKHFCQGTCIFKLLKKTMQDQDLKLDQILEEMVIMNSRAEMYTNFVKQKLQVSYLEK